DDAEDALRSRETMIAGSAGGRATEALCGTYGLLDRAHRRFQVSLQVPGALLSTAPGGKNRWAWDCAFPRPYLDQVIRSEEREHLPFGVTHAVMRQESAFDPSAVSPARAVGLLQLLPETASAVAKAAGVSEDSALTIPAANIDLGTRYLRKLLDRFHGNVPL